MSQKGVLHLLPLLLIAAIVIGAILVFTGKVKLPGAPFGQKGAKVEPKKEYNNPFKKETQYVNPFETYKNPFTLAK